MNYALYYVKYQLMHSDSYALHSGTMFYTVIVDDIRQYIVMSDISIGRTEVR